MKEEGLPAPIGYGRRAGERRRLRPPHLRLKRRLLEEGAPPAQTALSLHSLPRPNEGNVAMMTEAGKQALPPPHE